MQLSPTYTKILWAISLFVLTLDVFLISFSSLTIYYDQQKSLISVLLLTTTYLFYYVSKKNDVNSRIVVGFYVMFFFILFSLLIFLFQYLIFTTNFPLGDEIYASIDQGMGFNVASLISWFRTHYWSYMSLGFIYNTFYYQLPLVLIYFIYKSEYNKIQRFLVLYMIGAFFSLVLAGLFPAAGTYAYYNFPPAPYNMGALKQFFELRDGILDLRTGNGLIVFPSFHAVVALIYIYLFRDERKAIFIPILILNLLMIFSCLPIGEHYLIDIIGGFAVFCVVIGIEYLLFSYVRRVKSQKQALGYQRI